MAGSRFVFIQGIHGLSGVPVAWGRVPNRIAAGRPRPNAALILPKCLSSFFPVSPTTRPFQIVAAGLSALRCCFLLPKLAIFGELLPRGRRTGPLAARWRALGVRVGRNHPAHRADRAIMLMYQSRAVAESLRARRVAGPATARGEGRPDR